MVCGDRRVAMLVRNHVLSENMRLYIYLQQKMAGDEANTAQVRSFRKERDGPGKTVLDFLEKYKEIEKNPRRTWLRLPTNSIRLAPSSARA